MALTRLPSFTLLSTDSYTFGNANVSGNVAAGNLKTDHLLYANGAAWSFATISGSNTQVQFNDNGNFGSSANLTFDKTSNTLTVTYIVANGSSLSSITGANVTGAVAYATTANSVAGANVTGQVGNALVAGTVYTAAQPNITSVGTLTSLSVTGNIASGNANLGNLVTANFFSGNGHYLTDILGTQISGEVAYANKANSVAGANVTGQVGNALVAGTVYTNAQPNITSVGTLTSITTTGDASVGGNLSVTGNLTVSGTVTSVNSTTVNINDINIILANNATTEAQANGGGITINGASATMLYNSTSNAFVFSHPISANGALLSNIAGANVTGAVAYATTANSVAGANVSGAVAYATTANSVAGANVSGAVSYATTANSVAGSNVSGAVNLATYAGTANSVAGANVSGAVSYATTANSVAGANVSGEVSYAAVANSVAVANVSGIGNIATINKDGNASNILYGNGVFASAPVTYANSNVATFLSSFGSNTITTTGNVTVGNIIGNGQALTGLTGANVTGEVSYAAVANSVAVANVSGIGNIATINKDGNASNILYGNGVFAAAPTGGGSSYGDSNVATYLPNYAGNLSPGNISIGVSNLHITGGTNGYVLKTDGSGNLSWVAQSGGSGGTGASVTVSDTAPSTPNQGDLWLDSASGELNVYFGGAWASVTESATQFTSTVNYFTGDGATTTFTLTTTPASEDYTLVAVGGVLQPRNTYNVSGTSLIFSSAIPNSTPIEVTILGGTATPVGVAATVTSASQPNITSTGTLVDLQATGNILFNGAAPTTTGKAIAMSIVFGF